MDTIRAIFTNPLVWTAILNLANLIAKLAWPGYTIEAWAVISGIITGILTLLGIKGVEPVSAKVQRYRAERLSRVGRG